VLAAQHARGLLGAQGVGEGAQREFARHSLATTSPANWPAPPCFAEVEFALRPDSAPPRVDELAQTGPRVLSTG
jgi:hypothetical protein